MAYCEECLFKSKEKKNSNISIARIPGPVTAISLIFLMWIPHFRPLFLIIVMLSSSYHSSKIPNTRLVMASSEKYGTLLFEKSWNLLHPQISQPISDIPIAKQISSWLQRLSAGAEERKF